MLKLTLRKKLLFYSVALSIIPLGVAGRSMMRITQDELKSSANEDISTAAEQLARDIDDIYENMWLAPLQLAASGIDNDQLGPEEKLALVRAAIQNITDVVACQITIAGVSKPILLTKNDFTTRLQNAGLEPSAVLVVEEPRLQKLLGDARNVVAGDLSYVDGADSWLLTLVIPLETRFAGRESFLVARVELERLREYVSSHPFNRTGTITLIEADGREILHSERRDLSELGVVQEAKSMVGSSSRAVSVKPYIRPDGERMLAGFSFPTRFDWAVVAERNEAAAYLAVDRMFQTLSVLVLGGLAIAVLGALFFAVRISRPVEEIAAAAQAVGSGNLDVRVKEPTSNDEIAVLAVRMNEMIKGLNERDFIRETFGRYVSPEVAQQVLSDPQALHPGGELRTVTVMMSDLRGFTSLSERLSPAEMVDLLNAYLGRMSDIISEHGGTVIEFIGDAVMALFGAPFVHDDDPQRAIACAARMQIDLEKFNEEGSKKGIPPLQMGIGLNTGAVIVGNIGSEKRMKYGVVGDDVNLAARVESFTVGGEVLVSHATRLVCGDIARFRGPFEVKAKGKKEPLQLYALISVGEPFNVDVPAEHRSAGSMVEISLPVELFKISGKEVAEKPLKATLVQLGSDGADVELQGELSVFDNLKLKIHPPKGEKGGAIGDIYAKVVEAATENGTSRCRLRFTSVPDPQKAWLENQMAATSKV